MVSHTLPLLRATPALLAVLIANTAWAETPTTEITAHADDVPTKTVKFSDLNLATEEGSRVLYARLVSAAEQVCPPSDVLLAIKANLNSQRCIRDAVDRAAKQIRNPRFAEVAASQRR